MSGSGDKVSVQGVTLGTLGVVTVDIPVTFSPDIVQYLDDYFANIIQDIQQDTNIFFTSVNLDPSTLSNTGTSFGLEQITNLGTNGLPGPAVNVSLTVDSLAGNLIVSANGDLTLTGATNTSLAVLGSTSNVDYTVTDGVASSIFAAGGSDSITLYATTTTLNDTVESSGNDTINAAQGNGSLNVIANTGAVDDVIINSEVVTVTAQGNATVAVNWENQNAGGSVDFINNSTAVATVFSGIFPTGGGNFAADAALVTAFGGVGGGFFIGGQKGGGPGANFLVGGAPGSVSISGTGIITQVSADSAAGIVTLVGGADGSVLEAQGFSTVNPNAFFAGSGQETLIAASTTGANLFQLGLNYPGLGQPQSNGVVSTEGSGFQTFFLGNSAGATLYGSTAVNATGSFNRYNFVSDATAGGGVFTIENFASANSVIYLVDGTETNPGSATINTLITSPFNSNDVLIGLSDGTQITLKNTNIADVHTTTAAGNITEIF